MEYEIADEDRLFDDSTNPSLHPHERRQARKPIWSRKDAPMPAPQTAVLIPEEEHQLS
jgi:hypothetical protein